MLSAQTGVPGVTLWRNQRGYTPSLTLAYNQDR